MARRWPSSHSRMTTGDCSTSWLIKATVMMDLSHPHLVQLIGVSLDEKPVFIVTEFLEKGLLVDYLRSQGRAIIQKQEQLGFARDVADWRTRTWFTGGRVVCVVWLVLTVPALNQDMLLAVGKLHVMHTCRNQGFKCVCRSSACMCAIMHYVHVLCVTHSTHFLLFPAHPSHFSLFITAVTYCSSTVTYIVLSLHHFWYTVVYVSKSPFCLVPVNEEDNYIVFQLLICCNHSFWPVKLDDSCSISCRQFNDF